MESGLNFGLQFEEMGTGRAHFGQADTMPCPRCQGVELGRVLPITCSACQGEKAVPRNRPDSTVE